MSKTFAINAGSSSLKFQLYEMPQEEVIAKGVVERIGINDSIFSIKYGDGQEYKSVQDLANHEEAVNILLEKLVEFDIVESVDEISGVGHRVVAGAEEIKEHSLVTPELIEKVEELADFAPLHNPAEASVMRVFSELLPQATQVAVLDTAFHSRMPEVNYIYSLPYEYYEKYAVRRYGFHGTSHDFVSSRAAELMNQPIEGLKIITCHLGNGASIAAVDGGVSVDTSMGFTPIAGVTMGTRTGDIDPSVIPYLMDKLEIDDVNEMLSIMNHESGLKGISGVSSDMRDVESAAEEGNERAQLALDVFVNRVQKYIGQYIAVMNGVDAIVFTAGIGENSPITREKIINGITTFGCEIDKERNDTRDEALISSDESKIKIFNIPTDEEIVIAREVEKMKKA